MNSQLYKTVKFREPKYVGDPINAIRIFNEKEVDELLVLDISATRRQSIDYNLLGRINKEAFMPLGYGGGIKNVDDLKRILSLGYEKVVINSAAIDNISFVRDCSSIAGSQSIVCCLDIRRNLLGRHELYNYRTGKKYQYEPVLFAKMLEDNGAGELIIHSVDREGIGKGYDLNIISQITEAVSIPTIALGGAGSINDMRKAVVEAGASAVSAGSMFVFHGPHRAVLITYPDKKLINF